MILEEKCITNWPCGITNWSCGAKVTCISLGKAYEFSLYCRRWSCEKCHKKKIKEWGDKIQSAMHMLAGTHLFVASLELKNKDLSNFIQKIVSRGLYIWIATQENTAIICTKKFLGAKRKCKKHYFKYELPKLLESPWESGLRVSASTEIQNSWKYFRENTKYESDGDTLAIVLGENKSEFLRLETDEERAVWLADHRDSAKITEKGEQFIEQFFQKVPPDFQLTIEGEKGDLTRRDSNALCDKG